MKLRAKKSKSLAVEGNSLSIDEFKKSISEAEKGPFYTSEQSKKLLESWRKKKDSL